MPTGEIVKYSASAALTCGPVHSRLSGKHRAPQAECQIVKLAKFHSDLDEFLSPHLTFGCRWFVVEVVEPSKDARTFSFDELQFVLDALARHQLFKGLCIEQHGAFASASRADNM